MLRGRNIDFESVNYYATPLTAEQLTDLIAKLGVRPRDILRKSEPVYRSLELGSRNLSDDELVRLMVENPDLIQRPIVVRGDKAVLARPVENLEELL